MNRVKGIRHLSILCWLLAVGTGWTIPAAALMVAPVPFEALVARADVILVGTITDAASGTWHHPLLKKDFAVTQYTMQVKEALQGSLKPGATFSFRTLAANGRGAGARLMGVVPYERGGEYLLFLQAAKYDFWTPVGYEQGKFIITKALDGRRLVENGVGNDRLFGGPEQVQRLLGKGLSKGEQGAIGSSGGPIAYDDLLSLVRKLLP